MTRKKRLALVVGLGALYATAALIAFAILAGSGANDTLTGYMDWAKGGPRAALAITKPPMPTDDFDAQDSRTIAEEPVLLSRDAADSATRRSRDSQVRPRRSVRAATSNPPAPAPKPTPALTPAPTPARSYGENEGGRERAPEFTRELGSMPKWPGTGWPAKVEPWIAQ